MELLTAGQFGQLVVMRDGRLDQVAIESVAGQQRKVPLDHPMLRFARSVGTAMGD